MYMHLKASFLLLLAVFFSGTAGRSEEIATVTEGKINVRGKPSLIGEVITQLERGDKVTVLEVIKDSSPKPGEPTNWAKIKLPDNTPVWVFGPFIKDGAVTASRLNLRAGPGENYSVIGRIDRGTQVEQIRSIEQWMEIEAPPAAYAFVDATLLQSASGTGLATPATAERPDDSEEREDGEPESKDQAATATPQPQAPVRVDSTNTTPATTAAAPVVATAQSTQEKETEAQPSPQIQAPAPDRITAPPIIATPPAGTAPANTPPAVTAPTVATPAAPRNLPKVAEPVARTEEPLPSKRIVRREGIIRATRSIQAPTWYELIHPDTKKTINYLYEEQLSVPLKDYKGKRVIVSGEEGIDSRWPNTPILDVETLDVLPYQP